MNPSTRRTSAAAGWSTGDLPRGPGGRFLCRRCQTEVPKGRTTFCSKECVHEWKIRTDPGYLRYATYQRDKGICAKCSVDTGARRARGTGHLWQADHVNPVIEGGGECGLDNVQTLCTACHKQETAALRARMALARRAVKPLPLLDQA